MFICCLNQAVLDFQMVVSCFEKQIKHNHKSTFDQWFYDLSYKTSVAVALFTFGLCTSIILPFAPIMIASLISIQFYIDKYNLMYIYPLEFESQLISRKSLVKNSFFAIILFQVIMVFIGTQKEGLLHPKALMYILAFIFA